MKQSLFRTDQSLCYDQKGIVIPCEDTGQDAALHAGRLWPEPRFFSHGDTVTDWLTGCMWTKDANTAEFPLTWEEAMAYIDEMNQCEAFGYVDWTLPNRGELFSLLSHAQVNPALPAGHPFINVFMGYYWTSTTCARLPSQAWYVHLGGGRVFKGMKHGSYMVWPVRSEVKGVVEVPRAGQRSCYSESSSLIPCADVDKDDALQVGTERPDPRFVVQEQTVFDNLTGLIWSKNTSCTSEAVDWRSAFGTIQRMNADKAFGHGDWRLPNVRELESLTDMGSYSPALPSGHPFEGVQEYYWSSTTSSYDARYAWVVYLEDGAVGVGFKPHSNFFAWPVRSSQPKK